MLVMPFLLHSKMMREGDVAKYEAEQAAASPRNSIFIARQSEIMNSEGV